jgi:tetratricopeptide (TPR) repeat protein
MEFFILAKRTESVLPRVGLSNRLFACRMKGMLSPGHKDKIHSASGLPASAIADQAAKILSSAAFQKSKRLSRFLTYAVSNTLEGNESILKESVLGLEVFDRGSNFDPRIDPIVRIDARRLRARVAEYYQSEGATDPIFIEFEPGSYVPRFASSPKQQPDLVRGAHAAGARPTRGPRILKNLAALDLLRQGQQQLETFTSEGIIKSKSLFERAALANPQQEFAHLGLGIASIWMSILLCESAHTAMARARVAAQHLLDLNSAHAEAHGLLGAVQAIYDFDFRAAHTSFLVALRLDPGSLRIRHARAMFYLAPMGMIAEAIEEVSQIEKKEPAHIRNVFGLGWLLYLRRDYRLAVEKLLRVLTINQRYIQARYSLGLTYEALGQHDRADEILLNDEVRAAYPLVPLRQQVLSLMRAEEHEKAQAIVRKMEALYSPGTTDPMAIAGAFAAIGDNDRALQWLERAYEDRRYWLIFLNSDPAFDTLHSDTRFTELVSRMGLSKADASAATAGEA